MTAKYKIIGTTKPRRFYDVPIEAAELAASIERLELAIKLLGRTDVWLVEPNESADKTKWSILNQLTRWQEQAKRRLKVEYLAR